METKVLTPQLVFMQPQRLVVPLFQRPYVWNEENQWEPLWEDVVRLAGRLLNQPSPRPQPHFLGAVVLQQVAAPCGQLQERTIIDGQQRLTTLQLLLGALHAELLAVDASQPAARINPLVSNAPAYRSCPEDQFKVWPTNQDRQGFVAVMGATPPVDYDDIGQCEHRMVEAHRYFAHRARAWLREAGDGESHKRGLVIETVVRDLLQIVVIDLAADENAQEIFETLNARGAQLTAADLIKNFIFQRLLEAGSNVEKAYEQLWRDFETSFWEKQISVGRASHPRSSIFLNHWLVARTGKEVLAREVFDRFKRYADHDSVVRMPRLLEQVHQSAGIYRSFVTSASQSTGDIDRLGLFVYRTGVLESEVIKPLVLCLLDPDLSPVSSNQLTKALEVVESWMVRRMLVRATTKNYNQVVAELVALLRSEGRDAPGDLIEAFFVSQTSDSRYWPDDNELRVELAEMLVYRRLGRGRLRMVLEAIEDYLRGWRGEKRGLGDERVARGKYAIEHVMPRKWAKHWALSAGSHSDVERDGLVHRLGNLTLLNGKLNSKVSNGPWLGDGGKRSGLEGHDVLFLNRELLRKAGQDWTDDSIRARTRELVEIILDVWPVPSGHRSSSNRVRPQRHRKLNLLDLITGGALRPGMALYPKQSKHAGVIATLLSDGKIEVDGKAFSSPFDAASEIAGYRVGGWSFFLVDQESRRSLATVRSDYMATMAVDPVEDDEEDEADDE